MATTNNLQGWQLFPRLHPGQIQQFLNQWYRAFQGVGLLLLLYTTSCTPLREQYGEIRPPQEPVPQWEPLAAEQLWFRVQYFSKDGSIRSEVWNPKRGPLEIPLLPGRDTPVVAYPWNTLQPYGALIPRGSFGSYGVTYLDPATGWLAEIVLGRPYLFDFLEHSSLVQLQKEIGARSINPWGLERVELLERILLIDGTQLSKEELYPVTLYGIPRGEWVSELHLLNQKGVAFVAEGVGESVMGTVAKAGKGSNRGWSGDLSGIGRAREMRSGVELPDLPAGVWRFSLKGGGFVILEVEVDNRGEYTSLLRGW